MADIRIKDLATTATTTASDDFMAVDGTTNGTRKLSAATPAFLTSVTTPSLTSPASSPLTLAGGSSGASLVLGQGADGAVTISPAGTGDINLTAAGSGSFVYVNAANPILFINETDQSADARLWAMQSEGGLFKLRAFNDALSSAVDTFAATRTGNLLIGTTSETGLTGAGGLKINSTTAGSAGAGALIVAGGISAGGVSYFGGTVLGAGDLWNSSSSNITTNGFNDATNISSNIISVYGSTGSANIQKAGRITTFDGGSGYYGLNFQAPTSPYPDFSGTVNFTNVLTLTSQTATFAGAVTAGGNITRSGASDSIITASTSGTSAHGKFNTVADVAQATLRTEGSLTSGILFGTNRASATQLYSESGPLVLGAYGAFSAVIGTNNTARLTIDSAGAATFAGAVTVSGTGASSVAGNFGVGTTSPVSNANQTSVTINGTNYSRIDMQKAGSTYFNIVTDSTAIGFSTIGALPIEFATNGATRQIINGTTGAVRLLAYGAGTATFDSSGNITSVSDARLKNITGTFTKGLAEIVKLTPKLYTWKPETGLVTDDVNATLIAQDLIAAGLSEAVATYRTVAVMEDDVQSVEDIAAGKPVTQHAKLDANGKAVTQRVDANYSVSDRTVIAALVNAVKELKAEIDALKAAK